jgi:carbamoyltransferase
MRLLGLSAYYHDSAAVLLEDGVIVAAAQEERFTRIKHDASFPRAATAYCLSQATGPLDGIVYYEKPLLKFERILTTAIAVAPRGFRAFAAAMPGWLREKLWLRSVIADELAALGHRDVPIHFSGHHQAHAASAFYPSPFDRAAILTLDGVGEWSTTTLGHGQGNHIELLHELRFPHSLGLLYSAFTYHCGFRVNSGEYKLMGLAPYGEPRFAKLIRDHLLDLRDDGSFRLNLDYFGYLHGQTMTNARFAARLGIPARPPEAPLEQVHCDLARSIQDVTEEIVLRLARTLHTMTGEENLCMAGGVALNCVVNARLLREGPFTNVWIQPAAGDAGGALGAALAFHHSAGSATPSSRITSIPLPGSPSSHASSPNTHTPSDFAPSEPFVAKLSSSVSRSRVTSSDTMRGAFLGPAYTDTEIAAALTAPGLLPHAENFTNTSALHTRLAALLASGAVLGFCQGRAEFGPRALGARSILADPRSPDMQRRLNLKIKARESFRPFAPIVLAERATEFFDLPAPSPYMLFTAPVSSSQRLPLPAGSADSLWQQRLATPHSTIPAVTHVDYSARVQTVNRAENPALHALLSAFAELTGCPVLVNTSFNVRGEPPVCHPREAIAGFLATDMDALAFGPYLVEKKNLPYTLLRATQPRHFAPD